jgi:thiamine-monophosphate kinase
VDASEAELLEMIARMFGGETTGVVVGVGDDAAVVEAPRAGLVLTTDVLVEGTHFDHSLSSARDLGWKALAVNVSDIAAMGCRPRWALCALTLSDEVDAAWVQELGEGMREAAGSLGSAVVGGNLARGRAVTIAVTAVGEPGMGIGHPVQRSGAGVGDVVAVTGSLGGAAAGLRLLREGETTNDVAVGRYQQPIPRVAEGEILARHGATAMLDISDGLALDLSRLCRASGVGAELQLDRLPADPAATPEEVLSGGEDYELLVTLPGVRAVEAARGEIASETGVALTVIGTVTPAVEGLRMRAADRVGPLTISGWDHFG